MSSLDSVNNNWSYSISGVVDETEVLDRLPFPELNFNKQNAGVYSDIHIRFSLLDESSEDSLKQMNKELKLHKPPSMMYVFVMTDDETADASKDNQSLKFTNKRYLGGTWRSLLKETLEELMKTYLNARLLVTNQKQLAAALQFSQMASGKGSSNNSLAKFGYEHTYPASPTLDQLHIVTDGDETVASTELSTSHKLIKYMIQSRKNWEVFWKRNLCYACSHVVMINTDTMSDKMNLSAYRKKWLKRIQQEPELRLVIIGYTEEEEETALLTRAVEQLNCLFHLRCYHLLPDESKQTAFFKQNQQLIKNTGLTAAKFYEGIFSS